MDVVSRPRNLRLQPVENGLTASIRNRRIRTVLDQKPDRVVTILRSERTRYETEQWRAAVVWVRRVDIGPERKEQLDLLRLFAAPAERRLVPLVAVDRTTELDKRSRTPLSIGCAGPRKGQLQRGQGPSRENVQSRAGRDRLPQRPFVALENGQVQRVGRRTFPQLQRVAPQWCRPRRAPFLAPISRPIWPVSSRRGPIFRTRSARPF